MYSSKTEKDEIFLTFSVFVNPSLKGFFIGANRSFLHALLLRKWTKSVSSTNNTAQKNNPNQFQNNEHQSTVPGEYQPENSNYQSRPSQKSQIPTKYDSSTHGSHISFIDVPLQDRSPNLIFLDKNFSNANNPNSPDFSSNAKPSIFHQTIRYIRLSYNESTNSVEDLEISHAAYFCIDQDRDPDQENPCLFFGGYLAEVIRCMKDVLSRLDLIKSIKEQNKKQTEGNGEKKQILKKQKQFFPPGTTTFKARVFWDGDFPEIDRILELITGQHEAVEETSRKTAFKIENTEKISEIPKKMNAFALTKKIPEKTEQIGLELTGTLSQIKETCKFIDGNLCDSRKPEKDFQCTNDMTILERQHRKAMITREFQKQSRTFYNNQPDNPPFKFLVDHSCFFLGKNVRTFSSQEKTESDKLRRYFHLQRPEIQHKIMEQIIESNKIDRNTLDFIYGGPDTRRISLNHPNNINDDDIAAVIQKTENLEELDLIYTHIGCKTLAALSFKAAKSLKSLKIGNCIKTKSKIPISNFISRLKNLKTLDYSNNPISDQEILALVCLSDTLETLNLSFFSTFFHKPRGSSFFVLKDFKKLKNLKLANNSEFNDSTFKFMETAPQQFLDNLEILNISRTEVTNATIPVLQKLKYLEELDISSTKITDVGLLKFFFPENTENYDKILNYFSYESQRKVATRCMSSETTNEDENYNSELETEIEIKKLMENYKKPFLLRFFISHLTTENKEDPGSSNNTNYVSNRQFYGPTFSVICELCPNLLEFDCNDNIVSGGVLKHTLFKLKNLKLLALNESLIYDADFLEMIKISKTNDLFSMNNSISHNFQPKECINSLFSSNIYKNSEDLGNLMLKNLYPSLNPKFYKFFPKIESIFDVTESTYRPLFPNLEHIELSGTFVTSDSVVPLILGCRNLKFIDFSRTNIDDLTLDLLGSQCLDLEYAYLAKTNSLKIGAMKLCMLQNLKLVDLTLSSKLLHTKKELESEFHSWGVDINM